MAAGNSNVGITPSSRSRERSLGVPAYVISEVEVVDEQLAAEYRSIAADSIARYGGRYVIRGGAIDIVEGERPSEQHIVVVEFPTMKHAHDWYRSQEYAPALKLRATALRAGRIVDDLVTGEQLVVLALTPTPLPFQPT